jgi:hypothetical protein
MTKMRAARFLFQIRDDLIYCEWTLRRMRNAETRSYQYQNNDIYRDPEKYPLVEPLVPPSLTPSPQSTSLQIGFVPATPVAASPQPAP